MLFRAAADDGRSSAERVAALLPAPTGGWLPPGEEGPDDVDARRPVPSAVGAATGRAADDADGHASGPDEARPASPPTPAGLHGDAPAPGGDSLEPRLHASGVEAPDVLPRSWSDAGRHAGAGAVGRLRVLPSRSAVVALVLVAALAAVVAAGVVLRGRPQEVAVPDVEVAGVPLPGPSDVASGPPGGEAVGAEVVVAVAGKVHRPGLVRLPAGSRVDDAVRAAGGPVAGASTGLLNLARKLVDGEQVLVGVAAPPRTAGSGAAAGGGGLLDLNAATVADLDALPGIGPVLAQRIVDWRTENSRFASVDQLREVTGIGEAKFADLRAKVTV